MDEEKQPELEEVVVPDDFEVPACCNKARKGGFLCLVESATRRRTQYGKIQKTDSCSTIFMDACLYFAIHLWDVNVTAI